MRKKLTVEYAASLYGITPRGLRDLFNQNKAPATKVVIGKKHYWDIYADEWLLFLQRRKEKRDAKTNKLVENIQKLEREIRQ